MNADRLARLTNQQRQCLRLVYAHMSSKEIAQQLGVEPGTVDQYVKAAMRILGVSDRRAAARMLAEYGFGEEAAQIIISPLESVSIREEQAGFEAELSKGLKWPLPIGSNRPRDLSGWRRLMWILALMLVMALSFGVFLAGLEALSRLIIQ